MASTVVAPYTASMRSGVRACKAEAARGLSELNKTSVEPLAARPLTRKLPGVDKTNPRWEKVLKKSPGIAAGICTGSSEAASQATSRRPVAKLPPTPLLLPPALIWARKASTTGSNPAGSADVPVHINAAAAA